MKRKRKGNPQDIHPKNKKRKFEDPFQRFDKIDDRNESWLDTEIPYIKKLYASVTYYEPRLQNTVSVIDLRTFFDQICFCQVSYNFEFLLHKFAATTLRLTIPPSENLSKKETGLLYNTGKFIVVGSTSELEAKVVSILYLNEIGRIKERVFKKNETRINSDGMSISLGKKNKTSGYYSDIKYVPISRRINCGRMGTYNTVYKCYFEPEKIFLDDIYINNQEFTRYSPEAFPGVRIHGELATYLVFQRGVCLILGLSNTKNLMDAYWELRNYIEDAAIKKKSRDVISRYMWELNSGSNVDKDGRIEIRRKISQNEVGKKSKKKKKKRKRKKKKKTNVDNFEKRLTDHYSFGKYVRTKMKMYEIDREQRKNSNQSQ